RATGCVGYGVHMHPICRVKWGAFTPLARGAFASHLGVHLHPGVLLSLSGSRHGAAIVLKRGTIPLEVILGRQHPGVAVAAAGPLGLGQAEMRRLALAFDA